MNDTNRSAAVFTVEFKPKVGMMAEHFRAVLLVNGVAVGEGYGSTEESAKHWASIDADPRCHECNLPRSSHTNDGAVHVAARYVGGKPVLYCAGIVLRPSQQPTQSA